MGGATQILILLAEIASKYMDTLPNYEQSKKEQFFKAKKRYYDEINKDYVDRDDNLVVVYHDELFLILEAFNKEISGPTI